MKKTFTFLILICITNMVSSQVKDISVTGAPFINYTKWDKDAPFKNTMGVGGQLGFGFGRGVELRAIYQQFLDTKTELSNLTNDSNVLNEFISKEVKISQWGGEFKTNIPTKTYLSPYITLGSGVQTIKTENHSDNQIYASGSVGLKFNLSDRITLNLEGKASTFNWNPSQILLSGNDNPTQADTWVNQNVSQKNMINYSLQAAIQFYLGGQTPEKMNAIEKAYLQAYGGGLKGFKFVAEPQMAYINFDSNTQMKNTYLLGASAGFDFTEFVGLRAFYYQTLTDNTFKSFDKTSLYGAEFLARLNVSRGVVPYLSLGGGYMNVYPSYTGEENAKNLPSKYFAKAGIGLAVPLSKHIEIFGTANTLLTTHNNDKTNVLDSYEKLFTNYMYSTGIRIKLGQSVNAKKELDHWIDNKVSDGLINSQKQIEEKNLRIAQLESELKQAYENNDVEKAINVINEKQKIEKEMANLDSQKQGFIRLTAEQLQNIITQTINEVDKNFQKETVEQRLERLEKLLYSPTVLEPQNTNNPSLQKEILDEIKQLHSEIEKNSTRIESLKNSQQPKETLINVTPSNDDKTSENAVSNTHSNQRFFLKEHSFYTGVNFGQVTSGVIGFRSHYEFSKSKLQFVPDVLFGFSGKKVFGVNANVLYTFNKENKYIINPYAGVGLGLNKFGNNIEFGPNIILGTSFNILKGKLFADYTSRNILNNHQITVGYRFIF